MTTSIYERNADAFIGVHEKIMDIDLFLDQLKVFATDKKLTPEIKEMMDKFIQANKPADVATIY